MKKSGFAKGFIAVTVIFIIALSFAIAAIITLFWSKIPLSVSHLKRLQAINYTEAALYEAFNRFRSSTLPFDEWDADEWADWIDTGGASGSVPSTEFDATGTYTLLDTADTSIDYPAGQPIVRFGVPPDNIDIKIDVKTTDGRNEVLATLDQEQISL